MIRVVLAIAIPIALGLSLIQIPSVKLAVLEKAFQFVLKDKGLSASLKDVTGFFPFRTSISTINLSDAQGSFLSLNETDIRISLLPFKIRKITIHSLQLERSPSLQTKEKKEEALTITPLLQVVSQKVLQELSIEDITIHPLVFGQEYKGAFSFSPNQQGGKDLQFFSKTEENLETSLSITLKQEKEELIAIVSGKESTNGIISKILQDKFSIHPGSIQLSGEAKLNTKTPSEGYSATLKANHSVMGSFDFNINQQGNIGFLNCQFLPSSSPALSLEAQIHKESKDFRIFSLKELKLIKGTAINLVTGEATVNLTQENLNLGLSLLLQPEISNADLFSRPIPLKTDISFNYTHNQLQWHGLVQEIDWQQDFLKKTIGKNLRWDLEAILQPDDIEIKSLTFQSDLGKLLEGSLSIQQDNIKGKLKTELVSLQLASSSPLSAITLLVEGKIRQPKIMVSFPSDTFLPVQLDSLIIQGDFLHKNSWNINVTGQGSHNSLRGLISYNPLRQTIKGQMTASLKAMQLQEVNVGSLEAKGHIDENLTGNISLSLQDAVVSGRYFEKTSFNLNLKQGKGQYSLSSFSSKRSQPLDIKAGGNVDISQGSLILSHFKTNIDKHQILLSHPFTLNWHNFKISSLDLTLDQGKIHYEHLTSLPSQKGKESLNTWNERVVISQLPLNLVQFFIPSLPLEGTLSAKVDIKGSMSSPLITGETKIKAFPSLMFSHEQKESLKAIEITTNFDWQSDYLKWHSDIQSDINLRLKSTGKLNLENGRITPSSALEANIIGALQLAGFSGLLPPGDQMKGLLSVDLKVRGSLSAPQLDGSVNLDSGLYEISEFGTMIKDITLKARAHKNQLRISQLEATDGSPLLKKDPQKGRLTGNGYVEVKNITAPNIDVSLDLNSFQVVNNDSLNIRATGITSLQGIGLQSKVTGEVALDPADLFLEEAATSDIPTIHIVKKVSSTRKVGKVKKDKKNKSKQKIKIFPIELGLNASKRLGIQGFGLATSWKGRMTVMGYLSDTYLVGTLETKKGKLELFGKNMKIVRGLIRYDEAHENDPYLMVEAMRDVENVTVTLRIEGHASGPEITFLSTPPLPEEEILSRLLFGKELGKISAGQSLQLAAVAASFQGKKGLNIMDKIRSGFGLDVLELRESSKNKETGGNAQALAIGKDFGKIRVSIEQGVSTGTSKATVEAPIGKNLSVDVDIGGSTSSGVGLSWIKRY